MSTHVSYEPRMAKLSRHALLERSAGFARFTIGAPRQWLWKVFLWIVAVLLAVPVGLMVIATIVFEITQN